MEVCEEVKFTLPETTKSLVQKTLASQAQGHSVKRRQYRGNFPRQAPRDPYLPQYHYPERLPNSFKVTPLCFQARAKNLQKIFKYGHKKNRRNRKKQDENGPAFSQYLGTGFHPLYGFYPHYSVGKNRKRKRQEGNLNGPSKKRKTTLNETELFSFFASMNQRNADSMNSKEPKSKRRKKREHYAFKKGIMRFVNQYRSQIVKMEDVDLGFWGRTCFIIEIRGMQFSFHGMQFSFYGVRTLKKRLQAKKMNWNRIPMIPIAKEVSALAKEFREAGEIDKSKIDDLLVIQPRVPHNTQIEITQTEKNNAEEVNEDIDVVELHEDEEETENNMNKMNMKNTTSVFENVPQPMIGFKNNTEIMPDMMSIEENSSESSEGVGMPISISVM